MRNDPSRSVNLSEVQSKNLYFIPNLHQFPDKTNNNSMEKIPKSLSKTEEKIVKKSRRYSKMSK